jgi:hypothetical protein
VSVPVEYAVAPDFIPLRAALVHALGSSEAIVWQLIYFRTSADSPAAYERDGVRWWRANRDELARSSGLTSDQVKRVIGKLEHSGHLEGVEHRAQGITDRTKSYRCVTDDSARSTGAIQPSHEWGDSTQSSFKKKEEESPTDSLVQSRSEPEAICLKLAELIYANGSPKPSISKGWLDAARLLLGRDQRPFDEAMAVIEWCQQDEFWRSNILSMPTLRRQYDKLRLRMGSTVGQSRGQRQQNEALALIGRMADEDVRDEQAGDRGAVGLGAGDRRAGHQRALDAGLAPGHR